MNKILDKIKNVPIGVKAAAVYTLASVFSKGLAIITVPIFTRIMSTSEIGVVNLYNMSVFLEWTDRSVNRFNGLDADWFFCSPSI